MRHHPYSFVLYVEQEVKEDHLAGPIGDLVARAGSDWGFGTVPFGALDHLIRRAFCYLCLGEGDAGNIMHV